MKKLLTLGFLAIVSTSSFAADKFVCVSYNRNTDKLTQSIVVLTPMERGEIRENVPMKYNLELYKGANVSVEMEVEGAVITEDVSFVFESKDKKTTFGIYLDEMNESSLTISNKDYGSYICH